MLIRPATLDDFVALYNLGKNTPELKVSATEKFMEEDEFRMAITTEQNVFLVAEETVRRSNLQASARLVAEESIIPKQLENQQIRVVAEKEKRIAGFIYANAYDKDRPLRSRYACLVYLAVAPEFRGKGVAKQLYLACEQRCKELGITHLYGWAHKGEETSPIREFMKKQGFVEGHQYVWMDKKIG